MSRVTIDDALVSEIVKHGDTVRLCDSNGRVIGIVTPTVLPPNVVFDPPLPTPEELRAIAARKGPYLTTAEAIKMVKGA